MCSSFLTEGGFASLPKNMSLPSTMVKSDASKLCTFMGSSCDRVKLEMILHSTLDLDSVHQLQSSRIIVVNLTDTL